MPRPAVLALAVLGLALPSVNGSARCQGANCVDHGDGQGLARDAASCGRCHTAVHDEWRTTAHARAFVDPRFQAALQTRREPERCVPCHVPESVLDRLGQLPRARTDRRDDGVDCAGCHVHGDTVHGADGIATTAHATHADPTFGKRASVALCRGCHELRIADVLPLAREFEAGAAGDDRSCIGCHMPATERLPVAAVDGAGGAAVGRPAAPARRVRSHRLLGPGDAEFCASAFTFRVAATVRSGIRLFVGNAAGHGIPGLARGRTFRIELTVRDRTGATLHEHRLDVSGSNRILVEEERTVDLPRPAGAVALHVRVDHHVAGRRIATIVDRTLELP